MTTIKPNFWRHVVNSPWRAYVVLVKSYTASNVVALLPRMVTGRRKKQQFSQNAIKLGISKRKVYLRIYLTFISQITITAYN